MIIRCHRLGDLLTNPKTVDKSLLSETAKTMIREVWLYDKYGYKETVKSDPLEKGIYCEQESLSLIKEVLGGKFRVKNKETLKNDIITGTPDIITSDAVEDVKNSYSLKTFFAVTEKVDSGYHAQGQGYMWLTGIKNYRLIYTLNKTPEHIMLKREQSLWYSYYQESDNPDYKLALEQLRHNNNVIDTIPKKDRVKVIEFVFDNSFIEKIKDKHTKGTEYYNGLSLSLKNG